VASLQGRLESGEPVRRWEQGLATFSGGARHLKHLDAVL